MGDKLKELEKKLEKLFEQSEININKRLNVALSINKDFLPRMMCEYVEDQQAKVSMLLGFDVICTAYEEAIKELEKELKELKNKSQE